MPVGRLCGRFGRDFAVPGRATTIAYADYCTGNLTTTPRGVQREVTYDDRCRIRQIQTQDEIHEFDYDELNRLTAVRMGSRFAWGNPRVGARFSNGFYMHETQYRYDELDRVVEVRYPGQETCTYQYNENDDLVRMVDVHGRETLYGYYNDGRLLSVTYEGQVFTYTHDAAGRLESMTYPVSTQLVVFFQWDDDGRLLSLDYQKNSLPFQRFEYTYDDSGNRISLTETDPNNVVLAWGYGYDWLNRLTSVTKNNSQIESYTYDESDNRKTMTRPLVNELWEYSYDLADQLESITVTVGAGSPVLVESFTPDEDGNVLSRDKGGVVTEYQWDTMNRLRQVKVDGDVVVRSLYDAEGIRRLSKDDSGDQSKFFSSGGMSLADQRASGPVSFMQGHQLLGTEQGGDFHFYITDGLGSVRMVVDEAGDVEGAFAHDAWGVPDPGPTPPGSELRAHTFQGGLGMRNETNGIYYARQRWYDSTIGRWLSPDPIGFRGGLNLYVGMGNNPVNGVDPEGLDTYLDIVVVTGGTYNANGHAFIETRPIAGTGSRWKASTSYGTFPDSGLQTGADMKQAYNQGVSRTRRRIRLSNDQENKLNDFLQAFKKLPIKKQWSPYNNCAPFAVNAWNAAAPDNEDFTGGCPTEIVDQGTLTNPILRALPMPLGARIAPTPYRLALDLLQRNLGPRGGLPGDKSFPGGPIDGLAQDFRTFPVQR